jgi:hypothetical protein
VERVEGLRLAVDELCFYLVEAVGDHEALTLDALVDVDRGLVEVAGSVPGPTTAPPPLGVMTAQLVRALTDSYAVVTDGGRLGFRVLLSRSQ